MASNCMRSMIINELKFSFLYVPPCEGSRPRCCSNKRSSGDGPGPDHKDYEKMILNF